MNFKSFPIKIKAIPKAKPEKKHRKEKTTPTRKVRKTKTPKTPPTAEAEVTSASVDEDISKILDSLSALNFSETGEDIPDPFWRLEEAIDNDFDLSIFDSIRFPIAPNIIEWIQGREYLASDIFPHGKQFQAIVHFYNEVCYYCSDLDYIFDVPVDASRGNILERFALLEYGICPICRRSKSEILHEWAVDPRFYNYRTLDPSVVPKPVLYDEMCSVWGQRSGKSLVSGNFVSTYHTHRYLGIPDPSKYYGEPSNKVFECTFVAPVVPQVNKYLWTPFIQAMGSSPWFKEVMTYYKDEGKRMGVKLLRSGTTFVYFVAKRLALQMAAANSSSLRGATRLMACLSGDSLVNTTQGLIPIKNRLHGKAFIKNKEHKILNQGEMGRKSVQKTILEKGYSIVTTLDHRIKALTPELDEVWREAKDLSVGDFVAVNLGGTFPKKLNLSYVPQRPVKRNLGAYEIIANLKTFSAQDLFLRTGLKGVYMITHKLIKRGMLKKIYLKGHGKNAGCRYEITPSFNLSILQKEMADHKFKNRDLATFPSQMTPELGYLLGYYVSEGAYASGATEFTFSNTNEAVVSHFLSCFKKVFGFVPRIGVFKTDHSKVAYTISVAYKVVKKFLRYLGLSPATAATKKVPWSILQSPKSVVLAFLSAYIEGDGSISNKYVSMGSCSKKLLQQIQILLLNLRVVSAIKKWKDSTPRTHTLYALTLSRQDSIQLVPQLTCPTKGKVFNLINGKHYNHHYRIPFIPPFIDTSQFGGSVAKSAFVLGKLNKETYDSFALRQLHLQNPTLYKKALTLIDTGIIWLPVIKKRQLGSKPVFDISVDSKEHAFSANGVVVHNCIDELGWFNYDEQGGSSKRTNTKDGEEVFIALNRSLMTLRRKAAKRWAAGDANTLQAIMVNISSPSSLHDPIMQRAEISTRNQKIYYSHYGTHEVNPDYTEESLREEFAGQPETLYRDLFAIPPAAASPFISDISIIRNREFTKDDLPPPFSYELKKEDTDTGLSVIRPILQNVKPDKTYPRILTIDNGELHNSFALCLGRYLPEVEGVLFEVFMEVAPHSGRVVDLAWCHNEIVLKLVDQFNILFIGYDRWNSAYNFYDLRTNKKASAERYSLKWVDFRNFKEELLGESIWMSPPETESSVEALLKMNDLAMRSRYPKLNFQVQLITVNEFGRRLLKPDFGNDDLFRCSVLAHYLVSKNKKEFKLQSKGLLRPARKGSKVGYVRTNQANPYMFRLPKSVYSSFNYSAVLNKGRAGRNQGSF